MLNGLEVPILTMVIQSAFLAWGIWQYADAKSELADSN
jgi:hypothetical protein